MPKKAEVAQNQPVAKKPRKPYPTHEERVAAADQTIARLTALNDAREARIAQAEADLEARRAALEKSQAALEKAKAKKEHLLALLNRPPKQAKAKLTAEERAAHRREGAAGPAPRKRRKRRSTISFSPHWRRAERPLRKCWKR